MINLIQSKLKELEKEKDIRFLYAVESGSRAWGFASKDSDWDIRMIYIHRPEWYLSIEDKKDNFEVMQPNDLDFSGWDIRKSLRLFKKSNPPLLEWLRSPIVYLENKSFCKNLRNLAGEYFKPISCLLHYFHMAEGNFKDYLQSDKVRVKKYFYVLRPILACKWIEQKNEMAPMEFEKLFEFGVHDSLLKKEIETLLQRKKAGEELDVEPRIDIINSFLEQQLLYYKEFAMKQSKNMISPDNNSLNALFRKTLYEISW